MPAVERDCRALSIPRVEDDPRRAKLPSGLLDLRKNKDSLGFVSPQYFRNILDFRYINPLAVLNEGDTVVVHLDCTAPAPGATTCENAVLGGGTLGKKPAPPATPTSTPAPPN